MTVRVPAETERLTAAIAERERALGDLLERDGARIARACHDMARAFHRGGTLVAHGTGAAASDAAHVAVEFMHPVIVGKRALPALALANDPSGESTPARLLGREDIALSIEHGPGEAGAAVFRAEARRRAGLTLALGAGAAPADADHAFAVDSDDPQVVQEVQETVYHVLWELVHVFFEHPSLLEEQCVTCGDVAVEARVVAVSGAGATVERAGVREEVAAELVEGVRPGDRVLCHAGVALERLPDEEPQDDGADFLYPFLGSDRDDLDSVLEDVRRSSMRKGRDVSELRRRIDLDRLGAAAHDVAARLRSGGRLVTFGNGGSSTDAQDAVADFLRQGWPALSLNNDVATLSAVANDVGFDKAFARQLIALGREGDVALAISTSGSSANVLAGLEEGHRRGMLTIAITGYDGGRLAELGWLDHLFVAASDYVPRLQEAHATIYHLLLEEVGRA